MRPGLCALAVLLAACGPARDGPRGTSVGNPGKTGVALARGADLAFDEAFAEDALIEMVGCGCGRETLLSGELDLLGGDPLPIPAGSWCGIVLHLGSLTARGQIEGDGQTAFEVQLEPLLTATLWMAEPVEIDETSYVLELGAPGWLSREQLGEGDPIVIGPESDRAWSLTYSLLQGTRFYEDDGDGILAEGERAAGSLGSPAEVPPQDLAGGGDSDSVALEGCSNCATGGGEPPLGWLLALLFATGRRRTAASPRSAAR